MYVHKSPLFVLEKGFRKTTQDLCTLFVYRKKENNISSIIPIIRIGKNQKNHISSIMSTICKGSSIMSSICKGFDHIHYSYRKFDHIHYLQRISKGNSIMPTILKGNSKNRITSNRFLPRERPAVRLRAALPRPGQHPPWPQRPLCGHHHHECHHLLRTYGVRSAEGRSAGCLNVNRHDVKILKNGGRILGSNSVDRDRVNKKYISFRTS